jgi:hypothetical protein
MEKPRPGEQQSPKGFLARLDHAAAKMNAFLLVIAIGLGALDFTCFWVLQVREAMPAATRVSDGPVARRMPVSAGSGSAHAAAASAAQAHAARTGF